ncbi:hypothetical protein C8N43_0889 [Litoreibacter ponti]|uniref:Uncharacterized protein n=1 Tax=Litoreibacter ponti TaxID=1510457 RepID=A0A2T6BJK6_9RHOB|nr:hypothetical protein [Litoreibacter ponti]PTX56236.1 hypothetical protein C8N43_0889 [Litoreibacter ponti]
MKETNETTGPPGEPARPEATEDDKLARLRARYQQAIDENLDAWIELADELKTKVQSEWDKLKAGEASELPITKLLKNDLRTLLQLAMETEGQLYGHRIDRAGKAGAFAIDFADARSEIGRRLDRLRSAGGAGGVPEGPA